MNGVRGVVVAAVVVGLLACSGSEPSAREVRKAVERWAEEESRHVPDAFRPVVHGVEKERCEGDGKGTYFCEVTMDMTTASKERLDMPMAFLLDKGEDGWVAGFDYDEGRR